MEGGDHTVGAVAFLWLAQLPMPSGPPDEPLPLNHLAPKDYAIQWVDWCRAHADWAELQCVLYPSEARVHEYARLARWKANCWSLLANAHGECNAIHLAGGWFEHPHGMEAMDRLEEEIGWWNFSLGVMPQPWP